MFKNNKLYKFKSKNPGIIEVHQTPYFANNTDLYDSFDRSAKDGVILAFKFCERIYYSELREKKKKVTESGSRITCQLK